MLGHPLKTNLLNRSKFKDIKIESTLKDMISDNQVFIYNVHLHIIVDNILAQHPPLTHIKSNSNISHTLMLTHLLNLNMNTN